jgi:hypothetical protein
MKNSSGMWSGVVLKLLGAPAAVYLGSYDVVSNAIGRGFVTLDNVTVEII